MLNGQTAVDSIGLMHTRYVLSPDVCWHRLYRVEVLNCIDNRASDAIESSYSDILALFKFN